MNPTVVEKTKTPPIDASRIIKTFRTVQADKQGSLPTRIEILQVGMWDTPYHGMFMITPEDLQEYVDNFNAGIGLAGGPVSDGGPGLPIDFSHNEAGEAAGWIKGLVVSDGSLYADPVEWSTSGEEALLGGRFKCFSPTFCPRSCGGWVDPEDFAHVVENVLVGGALTNIPLFKGLKPIMASKSSGQSEATEDKKVIYISASEGDKSMTLEEVRAKSADALTEEEKTLLTEHKEELTAEEKQKFGFEVSQSNGEGDEGNGESEEDGEGAGEGAAVDAEAQAIAASVKKGESVVVKASEFQELQETHKQYQTEKAEKIVQAHVARGAIKADQKDKWVGKLVASKGQERKDLEQLMTDLPDNQLLASEIGSSAKANQALTAAQQIKEKATELVKAAKDDGRTLDIGTAMSHAIKENPELGKQYQEELKEGKE